MQWGETMKIGIMSMQRVVNYGSFLQAYGLKKVLETMGHNVEFVDYKAEHSIVKKINENQENTFLKNIKRVINMLSPSYREYRQEQLKINKSFDEFISVFENKYLKELGIDKNYNYLPNVDVLIIGSDEVFNCTQPENNIGFSKQLFGYDNNAKKLISYAASFGYTTIDKLKEFHIENEVGYYLSKFDAISVRDKNSKYIVESLTGMNCVEHIDPVLLYDFQEVDYINISIENYIVVYAYSDRLNENEISEIKKFAKKNNKKIISLGYYQTFCDDYILAKPLEVLAYIRDADYVITDTFHGTVFSIKYQKKFGTIIRDSNRNKIEDLLSKFNLLSREIIDLHDISNIILGDLNEKDILDVLNKERAKSINYLKCNLNKEEDE